MSRDEIINIIIIAVSEESDRPATLQSELMGDLDLDSLDFVNLAQRIEAEFGLNPIPDSDLFKLRTVEHIVLYIEAYLTRQAEAQLARETAEAKA